MECLICNKVLNNFKSLSAHIRIHNIKVKQYFDTYLKKDNIGLCKVCGKDTNFININKGYSYFCSNKCSNSSIQTLSKRKDTYLKNYGVDHPSKVESIKNKTKKTWSIKTRKDINNINKKRENTCIEKYNVKSTNQLVNVKLKKKATSLKNYGVDNPIKSLEIKNKIKSTNLKKYGVSCTLNSQESIIKKKETWLKNYGVDNPIKDANITKKRLFNFLCKRNNLIHKYLENLNIEIIDNYKKSKIITEFKCTLCNHKFKSSYFYIQQGYGRCPNCYPKYKSIAETEILKFIKSFNINIIENSKKIIKPLELDIYLPDKKIAIEYNGVYWHSEKINSDKNYHLNKLKQCQEKGITLIQIFEDEWLFKQDIVKHRLLQILNVSNSKRLHARKCIIKEIIPSIKNDFLNKYHLQGKDNSSIKLGAFFNEELVSVMTFSKGNIAKGSCVKEGVWELNRFCTNFNYHIPGIASKLLTYFKRNYEWLQIFSYADCRWSKGNVYYKLGFELEKETKPNYWYTKGIKRIHRFNLRKRPDEPKDITENILRLAEGYSKIWDCGHLKFISNKT